MAEMTNGEVEAPVQAQNEAPQQPGNAQTNAPEVDKNIQQLKTDMKKAGLPDSRADEGFYRHFMHPMLSKLEESLKKNNEILDNIQKEMNDERETKRKEMMSQHIPGPLKGDGQDMGAILLHLQNLIMYENYSEADADLNKLVPASLKDFDDHAEVAVLGHSIAAYTSTLSFGHLRQFATRIVSDTTLWVSCLFRFNDSSAYFHDDEREGLVRVCRLALHQKYPKYANEGYDALYTKMPVIYISAAARPGLGQHVCSQLGLPQSCLSTVPCIGKPGAEHKMDVSTLGKMIQEDLASTKIPVLIIAHAGSPLLGHVDAIDKLQDLCKENKIWLHIEGNNLATLATYSVPNSVSPAKSGDSLTLDLGSWLGLPAIPYITLYKTADPALAHAAGLTSFNLKAKLNCLPLWLSLQSLGFGGIVTRIKHSLNLAKSLRQKVDKISTLKIVGKKTKDMEDEEVDKRKKYSGLGELISKAINALIIFEIESPTLVFRYQGPSELRGTKSSEDEEETNNELESYFDALNVWLSETLKREISHVHISTIEVEGEGVCVRFSPLESAHAYKTKEEDISKMQEVLFHQLEILNATIRQREEFQTIVEAQDNLRLVTLPNWAGLGAVQYIPAHVPEGEFSPAAAQEINALNTQLVHQLKSSDTAFSIGTTQDSLACVRFGLITEETDLEELIGLVYTMGKEVEESSKFLEKMAETVREGIEKASHDLAKENEQKLMQEGVLRQIPLVGSLVNWWSPPSKAGIRGRTFSLASGEVASSESIYKYHMQVQERALEGARPPQGPLKANLKPHHSRKTSSSSTTSQGHEPQSPQSPTVPLNNAIPTTPPTAASSPPGVNGEVQIPDGNVATTPQAPADSGPEVADSSVASNSSPEADKSTDEASHLR